MLFKEKIKRYETLYSDGNTLTQTKKCVKKIGITVKINLSKSTIRARKKCTNQKNAIWT